MSVARKSPWSAPMALKNETMALAVPPHCDTWKPIFARGAYLRASVLRQPAIPITSLLESLQSGASDVTCTAAFPSGELA